MNAARAKGLSQSQIAIDWVRNESKATGMDRYVLLTFAFYVNNKTGLTYPTVETIARELGVNRRTVFRRITAVVELGELQVVATHGHRATEYRIVGPQYESSSDMRVTSQDSSSDNPGRSSDNPGRSSDMRVTLPLETSRKTSTTTTRDPRFPDAVKRSAFHRSKLAWVENEIAVRVATGRKLREDVSECDALNDWLIAHRGATPDEAGLAYARDEIPGTQTYQEPIVEPEDDTYGLDSAGYRIWTRTGARWSDDEYEARMTTEFDEPNPYRAKAEAS